MAPFCRSITKSLDSNAAWQTTFDRGPHEIWCEERERDGHVDLACTAFLTCCDLLDVSDRTRNDFVKPATTSGDRVHEPRARNCSLSRKLQAFSCHRTNRHHPPTRCPARSATDERKYRPRLCPLERVSNHLVSQKSLFFARRVTLGSSRIRFIVIRCGPVVDRRPTWRVGRTRSGV